VWRYGVSPLTINEGRVRKITFLSAFARFQKATISYVMPALPHTWSNSAPTGRILMKVDSWVQVFSENLSRKFKFDLTRITGALRADWCTFVIIFRLIIRMKKCFRKSCRENQNTHCLIITVFFFRKLCCLWHNVKNIVQPYRPQMTI